LFFVLFLFWLLVFLLVFLWVCIDSVAHCFLDDSRRQRWTPRKATSNWSAINIASVARLKAEGRMQPSGLAAYERRLEGRSAIYSYESISAAELPPEYAAQLAGDAAASAFWAVATPSYRRLAVHWVVTAKQEATREKRMAQLVEDSAAGRLIPSQRYGDQPKWVERAAEAARAARP
jgi:uncharacterized protein YdeI (YjbR/CyaY-like superfamily)